MNERDIFLAAIDIPDPAERLAYMDRACAGNAALRAQVESLLQSDADPRSFLDEPLLDRMATPKDTSILPDLAKDAPLVGAASRAAPEPPPTPNVTPASPATSPPQPAVEATQHMSLNDPDGRLTGLLSPSTAPGSLGRLGHYEVQQVLGSGGFGTVVRAFDDKLHRMVAIKLMSPELAVTSPARKRFLREARASAAVRHENIVNIHSVEEEPLPYLVMEFIPGQTLEQKLNGKGPLGVEEVLRLGQQMASGLAAAHATGLIHRDIKPANILLEAGIEERVKITDFGLARAADDATITQSGVIAGTPMYMAPEQAYGHPLDQRADLFSLGSVLYQMISGRPPFRAETTLAVLKRVTEDTPRPIRDIIPETPQWLCEIIAKLHAKEPADRIQTANELADLLGQCRKALENGAEPKLPWSVPAAPTEDVPSAKVAGALRGPKPQSADRVTASPPDRNTSSQGVSRRLSRKLAVIVGGAAILIVCGVFISPFANRNGGQMHIEVPNGAKVEVVTAASRMAAPGRPSDPVAGVGKTAVGGQSTNNAGWHGWPSEAPPPAIAPFDAAQAKQHQEAWAKYLKVPVEYTNSIGMKFMLIPPGEFTMGSSPVEIEVALKDVTIVEKFGQDCIKSETPQHKVILTQPIYLGVNEVTQAEYVKVMGTNPSHFAPSGTEKVAVNGIETGDHPVDAVSWNDAAEFCTKLSKQEKLKPFYFRAGQAITPLDGTGYRLPSEAEWEFSCRAGTATKYWIGDKDEDLVAAGWFVGNAGARTHAVGELKANPFGLYDIHGNVWEWVQDDWNATYYDQFQQPAINPRGTLTVGSLRVIRGGTWSTPALSCRSARRGAWFPAEGHQFGFRVALMAAAVNAETVISPFASPSKPVEKAAVVVPKERSALTGLHVGPVVNTLPGIIPRPARLPGIARWQAVTRVAHPVGPVAWSKQGQIVTVDSSHQLRSYDATSLELRGFIGPFPFTGYNMTTSTDGESVIWGGRIFRLDAPDSQQVSALAPVSLSPNGKLLAGQRSDGTLGMQTVDGAEVRSFDRPVVFFGLYNSHVLWSSDSRRLCVLDPDRTTVSILNLDGTTAASYVTGHTSAIVAISWSPDGTLLATASGLEYRLASVASDAIKGDKKVEEGGKVQITSVTGPLYPRPINTLEWSPDSQRLAIGTHFGLVVTDRAGKDIARAVGPVHNCHSLAWSPDGREIATGQGNGLVIWTADGKFARAAYRPIDDQFAKLGVEWNQEGTLAVTADDGTVRLWESSGRPGPLLDAPGTRIRTATWSPKGDKLLTNAVGPDGLVMRTWSATGEPGERRPVTDGHRTRWHSDGRRVVSYGGTEFRVYEAANEQPVVGKTPFVITATASQPKGNLLVVGGDHTQSAIGLWHDDGTPGPPLNNSDLDLVDIYGTIHVNTIAWHPTESHFAVGLLNTTKGFRIGSADGKWLETFKIATSAAHVAWSPDGRWLAMATGGSVFLRTANGQHGLVSTQSKEISSLAWSPDSRTLAIGLLDHCFIVRDLFSEDIKWVVQHLPPLLNQYGVVARRGAAVVFSEAGELLDVAHSVAAKSVGQPRATAEPPRNVAATLLERYAELDGLIYMRVETLAEPGKTQLLKPSEFVKLVETLARQPLPSFHNSPLDQSIDLVALAVPKLPATPASAEVRTTVPRATEGEYDVTLSVTGPAQPESQWFGLGLAWRGRPCEFYVDSRHAGLQRIDGRTSLQSEAKVDGQLVASGERIELICQIRQDGITILRNGETVLEWHSDPARLSAAEGQSGLGNAMPTLRCSAGWTIHGWTLTPRGKGMSPAAGPVLTNAKPSAVRQLLDDGYRIISYDGGHRVDFQGDYPTHAILPANDHVNTVQGSLSSRTLLAASQLPNLEYLSFNGGYFRPEFVPQLNQHTQVKELHLVNLNLRDEDLANLTLLDKLSLLALNFNPLILTDGLLDQLVNSRSLRQLQLTEIAASEESLMKLDRLVQLDWLYLGKSQVTDRVLDRLEMLPNLKYLNIRETPTTAARVEAFRKAKPNCQVEWSEKK